MLTRSRSTSRTPASLQLLPQLLLRTLALLRPHPRKRRRRKSLLTSRTMTWASACSIRRRSYRQAASFGFCSATPKHILLY
uniref:Uncharacterized protein n=1 Tax=Arundo donax TaxID=35708 RepID=A0A0A9EIN1_ARUDO